jgi:glycine/D-amino acid oxidase-like deaminating enzyme
MPHAVVVGAGAFGSWTAHHLKAAGFRVTLVDAYGPANSRASSGDETRILRCGYGPDEIYSQLARRSLQLWQELQQRLDASELPLWHPCGVLWLAAGDDPYTAATRATLERGRYPLQVLDGDGLQARYPHLVARDVHLALLEPECGVIMARRAIRTVVDELMRGNVRMVRARVAVPSRSGRLSSVHLMDGREIEADLFVFACGAWLPSVFPELLTGVIRPTRQTVVYFGTPGGDDRFGAAQTPAWVDFPAGVYGVPDLERRGMKVGLDAHGPAFDPDRDDRTPDPGSVAQARDWLARRFPAMADAPVVETRVCQYENTANGDFLIDRHPDLDNVWIAGGGSGHGFKHGPAVGEYVTRLITSGAVPEQRFSLAAKPIDTRRAIY